MRETRTASTAKVILQKRIAKTLSNSNSRNGVATRATLSVEKKQNLSASSTSVGATKIPDTGELIHKRRPSQYSISCILGCPARFIAQGPEVDS